MPTADCRCTRRMKIYLILAFLAIVALIVVNIFILRTESSLLFVNGFFMHGDKSLTYAYTYKNDPYLNHSYYPNAVGHMTMDGKRKMYKVGKELRNRYNDYLGEIYSKHLIYALTSNVPRTEETMQVLLAGLFKPTPEYEVEEGFSWQPVMYDAIRFEEDDMIAFWGKCDEYFQLLDTTFLNTDRVKEVDKEYKDVFDYITEMCGDDSHGMKETRNLYNVLQFQEDVGLVLPEWTKKVFPEPLKLFQNEFLREIYKHEQVIKYSSGKLLNKFGDSFRQKATDKLHKDHKINIFTGHEYGIHGILKALDIEFSEVPYGAYVLLELHNIDGIYGVKVYYQDFSTYEPLLKKIGNCETFCPLEDFIRLTRKYYPNPGICVKTQT